MRRPRCTPSAQTDGGDRSLGMIYLSEVPDKIDLNMARNTCSNLCPELRSDRSYARGLAGLALNFLVSRASGRSIAGEIYLNRRLGPNCLVGNRFQLISPHSLAVIPDRLADQPFST